MYISVTQCLLNDMKETKAINKKTPLNQVNNLPSKSFVHTENPLKRKFSYSQQIITAFPCQQSLAQTFLLSYTAKRCELYLQDI